MCIYMCLFYQIHVVTVSSLVRLNIAFSMQFLINGNQVCKMEDAGFSLELRCANRGLHVTREYNEIPAHLLKTVHGCTLA